MTVLPERGRKRTVLISGTSTGIGQATVLELTQRGWHVLATMRNTERRGPLEGLLARAGTRSQVEIGQLDVTDAASISATVGTLLSRGDGKLDAVVHNAGIAVGAAFEDLADDDVRRVFETNFFGILALTRALLPTFRSQRHGHIVVVSSDAAFFGQPANSVYCASKWAIEGWAEAVAFELAPFGIDVVLIEPGPYRTSIWESSPRVVPENSAYRSWLQRVFHAADKHTSATSRDPKEVAFVIGKVLEAARPRFRYPVGPIAHFSHLLRGKIPIRVARRGVEWYLGLRGSH